MCGDLAHEFQVLTEAGEDTIAICENGDYQANMEKARRKLEPVPAPATAAQMIEVSTPVTTTIDALQALLKEPQTAFLKSLLFKDRSGNRVLVVLPGDR